jgi:uncharacterized membrane protein YccC
MLGSIIKVFFGNIFGVLGVFIIIAGIFAAFFASDHVIGIGIIIFGILLISISSVLKR